MWTFGGTRIFVQDISDTIKQIIARLQPLSGGTIIQTFGYESDVYSVNALVVGDTDLAALKAMAIDSATHTLSGYGTVYGNFYLSNIVHKRLPTMQQTIRTDLDCESPVYSVDMELYL